VNEGSFWERVKGEVLKIKRLSSSVYLVLRATKRKVFRLVRDKYGCFSSQA
jgi:hypothetical protein